eukprot:GGOE01045390.1.p1 GENE.GGOE01045390.1~~GGOE01045390.1.p1  ORF type:complete len:568 (+),score=193.01 GGOE01045390.1:225-1706(+)
MAPYAEFFDVTTNQSHIIDPAGEIFMLFSPEGRHLWTSKAYSTTFPVVDGDVYILNERTVEKLAQQTGQRQWPAPVSLCKEYTSSQVKQVSDVFSVVHGDSATELAVGMLITATGQCSVTIGSETHNLTSVKPDDPKFSTPYIIYFNKGSGQAMRLERFQPLEADLIRSALKDGNTTTFLGMVTSNKGASTQRIVQYDGAGSIRWTATLNTPHPHNFLWSQSFVDDDNDHVLFISDPTEHMEINAEVIKHKGLVFGGLDLKTGTVAWKKLIPYSGIITSTFIQYMDSDLVLLGAIWDGQDDLDLGTVPLRRLRRPVQGMLGFFGVFDVLAQSFLFVQEVAPEMAYPGHHIGLFKLPDGTFQITTCPAFWDEAPQRLVDNDNAVNLPKPDTDSLVLVRYHYRPCHGSSGTSQRHGPPGRVIERIGHVLVVLLSVVLVGGVFFSGCLLLKRKGISLPALGMPNLFGNGRGYGFLSNREEEDEDPFHDIDYENDPL